MREINMNRHLEQTPNHTTAISVGQLATGETVPSEITVPSQTAESDSTAASESSGQPTGETTFTPALSDIEPPRIAAALPPPVKPPYGTSITGGEQPGNRLLSVDEFKHDKPSMETRAQITGLHTQTVHAVLKNFNKYVDDYGPTPDLGKQLHLEATGDDGTAIIIVHDNKEVTIGFHLNDQDVPRTSWETYIINQGRLTSDNNDFTALLVDFPEPGTLPYEQQLAAYKHIRERQLLYRKVDTMCGKPPREVGVREAAHIASVMSRATPLQIPFSQLMRVADNRSAARPEQQPTQQGTREAGIAFDTFIPAMLVGKNSQIIIESRGETGEVRGYMHTGYTKQDRELLYEVGIRRLDKAGSRTTHPYVTATLREKLSTEEATTRPGFALYRNRLSAFPECEYRVDMHVETISGNLICTKSANMYTLDGIPITNRLLTSGTMDMVDFRYWRNALRAPLM